MIFIAGAVSIATGAAIPSLSRRWQHWGVALACLVALGLVNPVWAAAEELHIAHINDHHSNLAGFESVIDIDGVATRVSNGGFGRLVTLFKQAEQKHPNLLKLHAGDALVGTPYFSFFEGQTDAVAMNAVCFDAFVLGNHEFDVGDAGLAKFLDALAADPNCKTPVLSANVVPAVGTPLRPVPERQYIEPYVIRDLGGELVGIVGVTVKVKTQNASRPLPTTMFEDEFVATQRAIDVLIAKGVRRIVVLAHLGYEQEVELARRLTGVDVVIGGDSHTRLGDFSAVGFKSSPGPYPTVVKNIAGDPVCVGQAWEYGKVFAMMSVKFDQEGKVLDCQGRASLVVGPTFEQRDEQGNWVITEGDRQVRLEAAIAGIPALQVAGDHPLYLDKIAPYQAKYNAETRVILSELPADQSLCLVRVPGTRNRGGRICETAPEYAKGSDVAQVIAEAYRQAQPQNPADIGLINAGGVRTPLETDGRQALPITRGMAFNLQPFTNELYRLQLTGQQVKQTFEEGVANWVDLKGSEGSHPYAAGARWTLDLTQPAGQRIRDLQIRNQKTAKWEPVDPGKNYSLITIDYLSQGFENYQVLGAVCRSTDKSACLPAGGMFADQSLINFIAASLANGGLRRIGCDDYSHQRVRTRDGKDLKPCSP